jgi:predicted Zn-dependent protease
MAIIIKDEAQAVLKRALSFSKSDECLASLSGSQSGNIRYALSAVSTAGATNTMTLEVSSTFGKRTGSATINEFDDASLEKVVRRAEELAKLAPENKEYMPPLGPQTYAEATGYSEATAAMTPDSRAEMVAKSLQVAKEGNLQAAGYLVNTARFNSIMNSKGLFAYHKDTDVSFNVTIRNQAGDGSGYIDQSYNDVSKLDTLAQTKLAALKTIGSAGARAIEPGKYTVILEPLAAGNMLGSILGSFDARNADEGRSLMSKKGGGTRLGEQLFDEKVTIYSDPLNPELPGSTWSGDGLPLEKTVWIDKGVVKNLSYSRFWADKKGVKPNASTGGGRRGGPGGFFGGGGRSLIMEGGSGTLEDLIKSTEKGILVTRLWYVRLVDPQTLVQTGVTRDGTFYIENGQIKYPIKNFRFNESPIIMLNNVDAIGTAVRAGNVIMPAMRVRDFTFSSLSDAI